MYTYTRVYTQEHQQAYAGTHTRIYITPAFSTQGVIALGWGGKRSRRVLAQPPYSPQGNESVTRVESRR